MKHLPSVGCIVLAVGLSAASAQEGTVFYSSTFQDLNGWFGKSGVGGTIMTNDPFVVGSTTMPSYVEATYYPAIVMTNPAVAASASSIWLGFLMRQNGGSAPWVGGVLLSPGTNWQQIEWNGQTTALVGNYNYQHPNLSISDSSLNNWASNSFTITSGQQIAVMAHLYDTNGSGTYNTADLWVQSDLSIPLFGNLSATNALDYGFNLGSNPLNGTINSLRLAGEGSSQDYANLILTSSSNTAIQFLSTGAVPEPSACSMFLLGCGSLLIVVFHRCKQTS